MDTFHIRRHLNKAMFRSATGFTLVEVLIALVILSIGLLGLAGMQLNGLSSDTTAYQRTQATLLAYDMADRMRANPTGITNSLYNSIASGSGSAQSCISTATGCTAAQIAQNDAAEWLDALNKSLPAGQGLVNGGGAGSVFNITVMWDEQRSGNSGTGCSGNANDLRCFSLRFQL